MESWCKNLNTPASPHHKGQTTLTDPIICFSKRLFMGLWKRQPKEVGGNQWQIINCAHFDGTGGPFLSACQSVSPRPRPVRNPVSIYKQHTNMSDVREA